MREIVHRTSWNAEYLPAFDPMDYLLMLTLRY